jgi:uncharacterized phage protein (TIGR01671 family)
MNREILFKAKRIDNGGWVEGYYIYHIKRTICPIGDSVKPEDEQHVIMQDGFSDWNMPRDTVVYEIDPDTLCQYTGLTDKNGKKIWENDILRRDGYWDIIIEFENGVFMVRNTDKVQYINRVVYTPISIFDINVYEVIGNIFDNPELLEVE